MSSKSSHSVSVKATSTSFVRDVTELVKLRLTLMVVMTSAIAYMITAGSQISIVPILVLSIGGFCVTAAANILNEVLEVEYDAVMERTKNRPLVTKHFTVGQVVLAAGFLLLFGLTLLSLFNPLCAFLGALSFVIYAFVYTPLKRYSTVAVFVGAVSGALPLLIGSVAFSGQITLLGILLFSIQFLWQYPHFWAIGYLSYDQYHNAGYKFIPSDSNGKIHSRIYDQSILASAALAALGVAFYYLGYFSMVSSVLFVIVGLIFTVIAVIFRQNPSRSTALKLMFSSLIYLPVVLSILLIDKLI